MSTTSRRVIDPLATNVRFDDNLLFVDLADGRVLGVPLEWFPTLRDATVDQRRLWRLIGPDVRIHWQELDEDLSVRGLLAGLDQFRNLTAVGAIIELASERPSPYPSPRGRGNDSPLLLGEAGPQAGYKCVPARQLKDLAHRCRPAAPNPEA